MFIPQSDSGVLLQHRSCSQESGVRSPRDKSCRAAVVSRHALRTHLSLADKPPKNAVLSTQASVKLGAELGGSSFCSGAAKRRQKMEPSFPLVLAFWQNGGHAPHDIKLAVGREA